MESGLGTAEAQAPLGALVSSFVLGVLAEIACAIHVLRNANKENGRYRPFSYENRPHPYGV